MTDRASARTSWAVALAASAVYALWCSPVFGAYDTAELAASGFTLGVTHPPGQPTYSMLAALAALLPLGSIGFRAALLSALGGGAAVLAVGALARALGEALGQTRIGRVAAPLSAVALAVSGPLAEQATRPEVYALAAPLFAASVWLAWRAVQGRGPTSAGVRAVAAGGLVAGLAATLHPAAGLSALLVGALVVVLGRPGMLRSARAWTWTAAGVLVGLWPFAWVAVRCRPDVPCWDDARTPARWLSYVRGAAYAGNAPSGGAAAETMAAALVAVLRSAGFVGAAVLVLAVLLESARATRPGGTMRPVVALLGAIGLVLLPLGFVATQPFFAANPDTQGLLLPSLFGLLAAGPVAAGLVGAHLAPPRRLVALLPIFAVGIVTIAVGQAPRFRRDRTVLAVVMADRAFAEAPPKALVLASSDHLFFGLRYGQLVEGARPDVGVMALGLAGRRSHWRSVARSRPELDERRVPERARASSHAAWATAALRQVEGLLPRFAESASLAPAHARSAGVLFELDGRRTDDAPAPNELRRALAWAGGQDEDASRRIVRGWRLERALAREARGELRAALREVAAALGDDPRLARALSRVRIDRARSLVLRTPLLEPGWLVERTTVRAVAARLVARAGRAALAARILETDRRRGHAPAALLLGELRLRQGRLDEATRSFEAYRRARPADPGYARVGLALVQAARGDPAGARRALDRVANHGPPPLRAWCETAGRDVPGYPGYGLRATDYGRTGGTVQTRPQESFDPKPVVRSP